MKKHILLIIAIAFTVQTNASEIPQSSSYDNRIQYVNYNEGDVVIIRALPGIGTRIVFSEGEKILDVASGFTQGWEFNDRRNILFVKPKSIALGRGSKAEVEKPVAPKWNTNLMVTTNKRMYDFDLVLLSSSPKSGVVPKSKEVAYRVVFRYPNEVVKQETLKRRDEILKELLKTASTPRNWNYSMSVGKESNRITPKSAYDDGRFTYLKFPNNQEMPAVFVVADDGSESIVITHIQDSKDGDKDELVVHRVAKQINLRLGSAVVGVFNENYDAEGVAPKDGTTIDGLRREVIGEQ